MGTSEESAKEPPKKSLPLSQPLLDLFWELSELDQNRQIEATAKLISALREETDAVEQKKNEDDSASKSLEYTLSRLIRGLASNRKGARWGFGTALTVLLQEFAELKTSKVLLEVEQHLKIVNPSDMKTIAVGQLTVYMALVNSGRMQTTNASHLRSIVDNLLKLESEKTYLRAGANEVLSQMIERVPTESFQRTLLPQLKGHLSKSFAELDLDGLFLLLRASQFHKKAMEPVLRQSIGTPNLLDAKNIDMICKLLFQTSTRALHRAVLEFSLAFQTQPDCFAKFWKTFLDLAVLETPWKAKIPFEVLPSLLKNVNESKQLLPILTQSFLYFLLRNAAEPRAAESESLKAMHETASKAMKEVLTALKATKDQSVIVKTLNLILSNEAVDQTSRSWSVFVTSLLHKLDTEHCAKVADRLVDNLKEATVHRGQIVKVLETILTDKVKTVEDVARFESLIQFFGREAFRVENDTLSSTTSKGILKYLASSSQEQHHRRNTVLIMAEVEKEIALKCAIMKILVKKSDESLTGSTSPSKSGEGKEKNSALLKAVNKLPLGPKLKPAFELFAFMTTGLWIKVRPVLGEEILTEFTDLVGSLNKTGKKLTDELAAGKMLALLLTLLAVESSIFGTVQLIFKALCPFLNEDAVAALFDLVEPVEEEDGDDEGMPIEFESSDEEEEDDDEDIEETVPEPVDLAIEKAALRQTPGVVRNDEDAESEPDLDDAAMFQLDEVLSSIMRSRKADKNGPASSEVDSRFRALRLVHILFCFPDADVLVILPFLRSVIRIANEKVPVSQRQRQSQIVDICGKVLQCLKGRKKMDSEKILAGTSREDVADVLFEVVGEIGKVHNFKLHQQACEAALFVQRVLLLFLDTLDRTVADKAVTDIYLPGLETFAAKRTATFGHLLWNSLLANLGEYGVSLLPVVLGIIFSDANGSSEDAVAKSSTDSDETGVARPRKYLIIRQVQLCSVVKNVMQGQARDSVETSQLKEFFTKFGREFTQLLKKSASTDGPLKGKKLLEDVTELARHIMLWHRKQRKHGVKVEDLADLWSFKKMTKWADQLLKLKLATKDVKAVKKAVLSFRKSLDARMNQNEDGDTGRVAVNGNVAGNDDDDDESLEG